MHTIVSRCIATACVVLLHPAAMPAVFAQAVPSRQLGTAPPVLAPGVADYASRARARAAAANRPPLENSQACEKQGGDAAIAACNAYIRADKYNDIPRRATAINNRGVEYDKRGELYVALGNFVLAVTTNSDDAVAVKNRDALLRRVASLPAKPPVAGLLPGEELLLLDNCATILKRSTVTTTENWAMYVSSMRERSWTGECRDGLANGVGGLRDIVQDVEPGSQEFVFGRSTGRSILNTGTTNMQIYSTGRSSVILTNVDLATLAVAWQPLETQSVSFTDEAGKSRQVAVWVRSCILETPEMRGCSDREFNVYGVRVTEYGQGGRSSDQTINCPDIRSAKGCDAVWQQQLAPILEPARALVANWPAYAEQVRRDSTEQFALWEGALQARRDAAAKRAQAEREAADKAAEAQAAARARADAAFQDSLQAQNAGQLFALADTLSRDGQDKKAHAVLSALLSRFPDSPLAPVAAQRLSSLGR